jgi:hypothetical protein
MCDTLPEAEGHISMLAILAALLLSAAPVTAEADPEPPIDQAMTLKKIAKKMDDLAARLKRASADEETRRLQKQVMEQLDKALRQAKAAKAPKGRSADVVASLTSVRAMQARLGKAVEALGARGNANDPETKVRFTELRDQQVKAAQILRDTAARFKPAR